MKKRITVMCFLFALFGCGGGGGSDMGATSPPINNTVTELQGTWIYSSDNHPTGGDCGLDARGGYGERMTIFFDANKYAYVYEGCWIPSGTNKGAYLESSRASGTFEIGGIYVASTIPSQQLRSIDFVSSTTHHSSYNLVGDKLHLARTSQFRDGTTPAGRAIDISYPNPEFTRQP